MAIDVTKLSSSLPAQEEGIEVKLLDEEGEETGCSVRVCGPDSKRVKKARGKIIQERAELRIRKVTGDRLEYEGRYMAAASCISWQGFTAGADVFECTIPNAMKLFEARPDFQEQVEQVAVNRAVFPKA